MKIQVGVDKGTYAFSAANKTITLDGFSPMQIEQVLLITNVTDNVIIYDFTVPALGGTISGNVITLTYNTTSMSDTDRLQIFLSIYSEEAMLLRRLIKVSESLTIVDSVQRQRIAIEAIPTTTVTGTVAATQSGTWNLGNFGIIQQWEFIDRARIAYDNGIRNKITFS